MTAVLPARQLAFSMVDLVPQLTFFLRIGLLPPDSGASEVITSRLLQVCRQSCMSAFWSWVAGPVAGCRCRVPLQGAAAGCRCKVLLHGAAIRAVQGAGCLVISPLSFQRRDAT